MGEPDRLLTAKDLAAYLEVPVATLYAWRYRGEGPPGFRVGRHLRYRWCDVQEWIRSQLEQDISLTRQAMRLGTWWDGKVEGGVVR